MNISLRVLFTRALFITLLFSHPPSEALIFGRVVIPVVLGAGGYLGVQYGPAFIRLNSYYDISEYIAQKKTESWYAQTRDLNESLIHDLKSVFGNASIVSLPKAWLINAMFAFSADTHDSKELIKYLNQDAGSSLSIPSTGLDASTQSDWKKTLLKDLYAISQSADRYLTFIKEQDDYQKQRERYLDEYVAGIAREVAMIKSGHLRKKILNFSKRIFNWDFINSFTKE